LQFFHLSDDNLYLDAIVELNDINEKVSSDGRVVEKI
jgi:hypothetical protein